MQARDRPGFLVPLVLCVAWAPAALPCSGDAAADSAVRAVVEGLIAADNARDIGRVLDSYAADAVLMPPNEPPLTQRAELEARDLVFLLGGADGLPPAWKGKADLLFSLSPLTFPHELARAIVAEQVYRALTTLRGHPYPR